VSDPRKVIQSRLAAMPTMTENYEDDDEDDVLEIYGDESLSLGPAQIPMWQTDPVDEELCAIEKSGTPTVPPCPPPLADLPPPPPPEGPPPPPPSHPPLYNGHRPISLGPRRNPGAARNPYLAGLNGSREYPRASRWARYVTDLFDSDRLRPFSTARPLPLGF
jgi:hypothetical protein